jgi:hypothetical protein
MRTSIRAAGAVLAAFALVHCGGPQPTNDAGDAGRDASNNMTDAAADSGMRPDSSSSSMSSAGAMCTDDSMCNGLSCDTSVRGGFCTGDCTNNASQANEQMQCGGTGSTCLSIGDGDDANTFCTKSCRPTNATSCRPGYVCTGFWYTHMNGTPDTAGCFPFCSSDEHCNTGQRCNPRTGSCSMNAPNPMGIPDGMPCTVPAMNAPSPCRGVCFRLSENPNDRRGICGSFVNLATTRECPDDPENVPLLGRSGSDNLGLCLFRRCSTSLCCPMGLVCESSMPGDTEGVCLIDNPEQPDIPCSPGGDGGLSADAAAVDAGEIPPPGGDGGMSADAAADGGDRG